MASELKWLDEDFNNYGVVQLDEQDPVQETLTLKSPPEVFVSEKLTIKQSFQIDSEIVLIRLKKALWPLKSQNFFEDTPADLYAPFWILTTLILIISTASAMKNHTISTLMTSAGLYYSLALSVPGVIYCLLSHNGSNIQYYYIISLYGYSLVHFLFPAIFSYFLHWVLGWIIWTVAAVFSLWMLKQNLWEEIEKYLPKQAFFAAGAVVCGHLCIVISANLYFLASS